MQLRGIIGIGVMGYLITVILALAPQCHAEADELIKVTTRGLTENIPAAWRQEIGTMSGQPVVSGRKVLIGTNNNRPRDLSVADSCGVLMCFESQTGRFLWQSTHPALPSRVNDLPGLGLQSRPYVDGDLAYFVSNRGELVCVDINGFLDGSDDGSITTESSKRPVDADICWRLDMIAELGVFKRDARDVMNPICSPTVFEDLVYCVTGNGAHLDRVPSPDAPSFLAVQKADGRVRWSSNLPGNGIVYGQWSSPTVSQQGTEANVFFGGGDSVLYCFNARSGELRWKADCAVGTPPGTATGPGRDFFVNAPAVALGLVFVSLNRDLETSSSSPKEIRALNWDDGSTVWTFNGGGDFGGTFGALVVKEDVLYALSDEGVLFAIDAKTGMELWRADIGFTAAPFGSPYIAGDRVLVADADGSVSVFAAGRRAELIAVYDFRANIYGTGVAVDGDWLYVATSKALWCIPFKQ